MPSVISQQGITNTFPGGTVTHMPAQPQQFPDPRGAVFQLPAQMMAGFSNNFGSLASGLGGLGGALGQMSGQQSSALAGLGNALAQNYGAYGGTIGNIANAASADNVGRYGAMANATQANQLGLGNLWTQAMAQLGGLGNTIANSMGQGQTGYQSALAGMQAANQGAVSQYGQSRMQNLARLGAADAVQNMNFDFGGGGGGNQFAASGPQGAIASGSYGGGGSGGGISGGGADMGSYRDDIMDGSVLSQLAQADMDARERMDRQQDMYRQDYGNLFGSGLSGLLTMGREGTGALREGMGDFYSNMDRNRTNFGEYLDAARQGFGQSSSDIRGIGDRMSRDYGSSLGALTGLASQIGSGMRDANQTGVDFANNFLQRYMPTPEEEYRRSNRLGAMRAADRESAMMRSPYVAAYNAYRDRQRAAERRMPVMR